MTLTAHGLAVGESANAARPTVGAELVLNAAQRVRRAVTGRAAVPGEQRAQLGVEVAAGGPRLPESAYTHATDVRLCMSLYACVFA